MLLRNLIFYGLLVFIPISIGGHLAHWNAVTIFLTAAIAIIPLAGWMGTATEEIAVVAGPTLGGLLNATFGNATELIIAIVALNAGLINVVQASLTGSIISNLLLVMGLAMFLGGLRYKEQEFQPIIARVNASSMNLAVVALLLPTALVYTSEGLIPPSLQTLSVAVAFVLMGVYALTLLFSMRTHTYLYEVGVAEGPTAAAEVADANLAVDDSETRPNVWLWIGVLLVATVLVAVESELLVGTLEVATHQLGLTELFAGVILLPVVGNAAEHATAVTVAMKNKMDLSVSVAVGSSLQIALFVAPLLVIIGWVIGQPMDLNFSPFELVAVAVAVLITNSISSDGRSNWLEGILLLATYVILAIAFYFHPVLA